MSYVPKPDDWKATPDFDAIVAEMGNPFHRGYTPPPVPPPQPKEKPQEQPKHTARKKRDGGNDFIAAGTPTPPEPSRRKEKAE